MTREEWNHINGDLINVFHWLEEFEDIIKIELR